METLYTLTIPIICLISIILGFIALLKQRVYMDSNTREPVEYDIPLIGKLKTNYPAILFVVLGFSLLAYDLSVTKKVPVEKKTETVKLKKFWEVEGRLVPSAANSNIDFSKFDIDVHPSTIETFTSPGGAYLIKIQLDEGKKFEEEIERVKFTGKNWEALINPHEQFYSDSLIETQTETTRKFKPLKVNVFE
jgi:hypothetical protein